MQPRAFRRGLLPFAGLGAVLLWSSASSAQFAPFVHPPMAVNANATIDAGPDEQAEVATDESGTWIAAWGATVDDGTVYCPPAGPCGPDYDIFYARSTDSGATWSYLAPLNTDAENGGANDYYPHLAGDGQGNWVAVWTRSLPSQAQILSSRSTDDGLTWSAPQPVTPYNAAAFDLETDHNGVWMVAWATNAVPGYGGDADVFVSRSLDAGQTWSALIDMGTGATDNPSATPDDFPRIATDRQGNWIGVWISAHTAVYGADRDIFSATSTDGGLTWSLPIAVNSDAATDDPFGAPDDSPDIASDSRGAWVVVWHDCCDITDPLGADGDILFARSLDLGASWSARQPVDPFSSSDPRQDFIPRIESNRSGHWVVAWEASVPPADVDLLYALGGSQGAVWASPELLNTNASSDSGDDFGVEIAADASGGWVAVWSSYDDLDGTIFGDLDVLTARFVASPPYPANDLSFRALPVSEGTFVSSNQGATDDGSSSCPSENDVWYRFDPPFPNGTLYVDTCGSNDLYGIDTGMDTVVSLHGGAPGTTANQRSCNDDWPFGGVGLGHCAAGADQGVLRDSEVAYTTPTTDPIYIRVANYPGTAASEFELELSYLPEPSRSFLQAAGLLGLLALYTRRRRATQDSDPTG